MMRLRSWTLLAGLLLMTLPMLADTTYTYTGNAFTAGSGAITGFFTVAAPLGNNLSFVTFTPASFSFSDGSVTLASGDPLITSDVFTAFSTAANGNITSWAIQIGTSDNNVFLRTIANIPGNPVFDEGLPGGVNGNDPGTWSSSVASPVPEPSALILLGTGVLAVVGAARRRFELDLR
jgi:hypothetical protein